MTDEAQERRNKINDNFRDQRMLYAQTARQWLRRQPPLVRQALDVDMILNFVRRMALQQGEVDVGKVLAEFCENTETVNADLWVLEKSTRH